MVQNDFFKRPKFKIPVLRGWSGLFFIPNYASVLKRLPLKMKNKMLFLWEPVS